MDEQEQIAYMQTRITRMAASRWGMAINAAANLFAYYGVFEYIERHYGLFHLQGDDAVFSDVEAFIRSKGGDPLAELE